ncbi:MAG TPA: YfiR family protein [Candidatus Didemnitutus sp.]|jgi:hypothetical protein
MPACFPISRQWRCVAVFLALLFAGRLESGVTSREYDVKAAFLFNFASFVEWPPKTFSRSDGPLVIGVLGRDPFGPSLDEIVQDQHSHDHALIVCRFSHIEDMPHCHILFVCSSEERHMTEILRRLRGQPVLTVGDLPGFAAAGGGIGFVTTNHVGLEINPQAIRAANLVVSAKLYKVARVVGAPFDSP